MAICLALVKFVLGFSGSTNCGLWTERHVFEEMCQVRTYFLLNIPPFFLINSRYLYLLVFPRVTLGLVRQLATVYEFPNVSRCRLSEESRITHDNVKTRNQRERVVSLIFGYQLNFIFLLPLVSSFRGKVFQFQR